MITRIGHAEDAAVAEPARTRHCCTGTVVPPASRKAAPRATPIHAERADEGRHPQARDQQAVDDAGNDGDERRAASDADQHRQRQAAWRAPASVGDMRGDDGGQAHDEADRQVDAAGDDDEGLAERQQQRRHGEDARSTAGCSGLSMKRDAVGEPRPGLEEDEQQRPGTARRAVRRSASRIAAGRRVGLRRCVSAGGRCGGSWHCSERGTDRSARLGRRPGPGDGRAELAQL